MTVKVSQYFGFFAFLMAFACLFSGCSADDSTPSEAADEICVNPEIWQMMKGTRATTFDNDAAIQSEGAFTCTIYDENTTTVHYSATQVDWSTDHWEFHNVTYRWPVTDVLDFFAYMPAAATIATDAPYISAINYAVSGEPAKPAPQFTCAGMPMTSGGQSTIKEFVYALTIGQDREHQGESGVTMKFYHPFARIKMQLAESHPDIIINSITFKGLKTGGTCTFGITQPNPPAAQTSMYNTSTWSSQTGSSDFVVTLTGNAATFNDNPESTVPIGGYAAGEHTGVDYIMVPQNWAGDIEVNATWIDWGESIAHTVTASVPTTWVAGYSYTYTFTISETDLKVEITDKYTEQW